MTYWAEMNDGFRVRMYDSLDKSRRFIIAWMAAEKKKVTTIPFYKSKDARKIIGAVLYRQGSFYWLSNVITPGSDYRFYMLNSDGFIGPMVSPRTARLLEDQM